MMEPRDFAATDGQAEAVNSIAWSKNETSLSLRIMESGSPVSVSKPSPLRAAVMSLARYDSARAIVRNESLNCRPSTIQRTR
jgi:hypothetical protein